MHGNRNRNDLEREFNEVFQVFQGFHPFQWTTKEVPNIDKDSKILIDGKVYPNINKDSKILIDGKVYCLIEDQTNMPKYQVGDKVYAPFFVQDVKLDENGRIIYLLSLNPNEKPLIQTDEINLLKPSEE